MATLKNPLIIIESTVDVQYGIVKNDKDRGLVFAYLMGLFKSEYGYYLSIGKRGDTLKGRVESCRYMDMDSETRSRKAVLMRTENCIDEKQSDFFMIIADSLRKMNVAYESSTKVPHPIYIIDNINSEIAKML